MSRVDSMLMLGGLVIPLHARMEWSQTYAPISGGALLRMGSGAAFKQTHWRKLATTVTATGALPPALDGLNFDGALTMRCAAHREVSGTGLTYTLPAARRSDSGFAPRAYALLGRDWVPAAVSVTSHVATITAVTGASQYRVMWWPELSVYCEPPEVEYDIGGAVISWTLEAEEA
jgi:hypothetical protein